MRYVAVGPAVEVQKSYLFLAYDSTTRILVGDLDSVFVEGLAYLHLLEKRCGDLVAVGLHLDVAVLLDGPVLATLVIPTA